MRRGLSSATGSVASDHQPGGEQHDQYDHDPGDETRHWTSLPPPLAAARLWIGAGPDRWIGHSRTAFGLGTLSFDLLHGLIPMLALASLRTAFALPDLMGSLPDTLFPVHGLCLLIT
ncbi:hypothetical protein X759_00615 [Mesorhizobium sp. LSHC420B00]|nr:hypothetical protein X759_00615 [Mesorhizobium sp. LSHC420B00]